MKKIKKIWQRDVHKNASKIAKEQDDADRREKNLEEAKKISVSLDSSLPDAKLVLKISKTN